MLAAQSRPTRGAWIEMIGHSRLWQLRRSRPTRGAWIEIAQYPYTHLPSLVAPHTGRVD